MISRFLWTVFASFLALTILIVSIFKGAAPRYAFSPASPTPVSQADVKLIDIDYQLPYPGKIIPDNPLWYIKVFRDKMMHLVTFGSINHARLNLKCADKRIQMSKILFEKGKSEMGYATLVKAEKYLDTSAEYARKSVKEGKNSNGLYNDLATSALKHREIIKEDILPLAPEDARSGVIKTEDYSKNIYNEAREMILAEGQVPPINPFETE